MMPSDLRSLFGRLGIKSSGCDISIIHKSVLPLVNSITSSGYDWLNWYVWVDIITSSSLTLSCIYDIT